MSECRSLTNFIGNAVATLVVSRWENALDHEQLKIALEGSGGEPAFQSVHAKDAEPSVSR